MKIIKILKHQLIIKKLKHINKKKRNPETTWFSKGNGGICVLRKPRGSRREVVGYVFCGNHVVLEVGKGWSMSLWFVAAHCPLIKELITHLQ